MMKTLISALLATTLTVGLLSPSASAYAETPEQIDRAVRIAGVGVVITVASLVSIALLPEAALVAGVGAAMLGGGIVLGGLASSSEALRIPTLILPFLRDTLRERSARRRYLKENGSRGTNVPRASATSVDGRPSAGTGAPSTGVGIPR